MLWVLLLIGFVAGIFLIPAFCASRFKKLKQSNGIDEKEKDGSKEIEEEEEEEDKEEEEEEEMGIVKPKGIKLFTLEEFEDLIRVVHNEDGTVTSKLVGMITNENRDEPKSELAPVSFVRLSIFDNETRGTIAEDMRAVRSILDGSVEATALEGRGMGSMLGMAIADAMGHRFEFKPVYYGEPVLLDMGNGLGGVFKLAPGQWTDDTSMGLCIADSLLMCNGEWNPHDCMNRFIAWWYGGYDNAFRFDKALRSSCGLGGNVKN